MNILLLSRACATFAVAVLAGCTAPQSVNQVTVQQIASMVTREADSFRKTVTIRGPNTECGNTGLYAYQLVATYSEGNRGSTTYSILVKTERWTRQGWAFWEQAFDSDGTHMLTEVLRRDVLDGGMTSEVVSLGVSREYLERISQLGMVFRLDGKNDRLPFRVTGKEIQAFLSEANKG